jgi:hypothetical protein
LVAEAAVAGLANANNASSAAASAKLEVLITGMLGGDLYTVRAAE